MSSLVSVLSSSPEEAIVDSPGFAHLFVALRGAPLQPAEREQLRAWLATINDAADCVTLIEQAPAGKCCPRCCGARAHRCGRASDLQRWRCLACDRSYNALSGTEPGAPAPQGTLATLSAVPARITHRARQRRGSRGAPNGAFASQHGITHETVNLRAGIRARGAIHLNHVNGWHSRFKHWLAPFYGVASRYLIHHSGWRRVLDARSLTAPAQLLAAAVKAG